MATKKPAPRLELLAPGTTTVEGAQWTRNEIVEEMLDLTTDSLHIIRSVLDGGKPSKDALLAAKWVIDSNIKILTAAKTVEGEDEDVVELRDILSRAALRGRR